MTKNANTIGHELKVARVITGLSQSEVAKTVGIANTYLSDIERGKYVPSPRLLRDLKEAVGWTPAIAALVEAHGMAGLEVISDPAPLASQEQV